MLLCICRGVSEQQARRLVIDGGCSLKKLRCETGLGTQCGVCRKAARALVRDIERQRTAHYREEPAYAIALYD